MGKILDGREYCRLEIIGVVEEFKRTDFEEPRPMAFVFNEDLNSTRQLAILVRAKPGQAGNRPGPATRSAPVCPGRAAGVGSAMLEQELLLQLLAQDAVLHPELIVPNLDLLHVRQGQGFVLRPQFLFGVVPEDDVVFCI